MLAYVDLIQKKEKAIGCDVFTHQKWSGASYSDRVLNGSLFLLFQPLLPAYDTARRFCPRADLPDFDRVHFPASSCRRWIVRNRRWRQGLDRAQLLNPMQSLHRARRRRLKRLIVNQLVMNEHS